MVSDLNTEAESFSKTSVNIYISQSRTIFVATAMTPHLIFLSEFVIMRCAD